MSAKAIFRSPNETTFFQCEGEVKEGFHEGFVFAPFEGFSPKTILGNVQEFDGNISHNSNENNSQSTDKTNYISSLNRLISNLEENQKTVVSRTKQLTTDCTPEEIIEELNQLFPNAFIYFLSTKEYGSWFGASPENLLAWEENKFSTYSLAGTKTTNTEWTSKEFTEQEIVTEYITQQLSTVGVTIPNISQPETITAANIQHLKTVLNWEGKELPEIYLKLLHPTPAVCGYPLEKAQKFIQENEEHNRELYTGFLGYSNKKQGRIYVNLRCGKFTNKSITLFAGGGITKDSNPENEWQETENKLSLLCKIALKHKV